MPVGTARMPQPSSIISDAMNRPMSVFGAMSPNPTVVTVVIAQYTATGMLVKPFSGSLDQIDERPADQHDHQHGREEDRDLAPARDQRFAEEAILLDVRRELEDAEDAQQPQHADVDQRRRFGEEQRQVGGQDREQVDDAEEARRVAERAAHRAQPQHVLEREDQREAELDAVEDLPIATTDRIDAVQHHDDDAGDDQHEQPQIEDPPGARIRLEDHAVQREAPAAARPAELRIVPERAASAVARLLGSPRGHASRRRRWFSRSTRVIRP